VIATYRKILDLLDRRERRQFALLMLMILAMGLLEVAGVASILPFLAVLADPQIIHERDLLSTVYHQVGFQSEQAFLAFFGGMVFTLVFFGLAFKSLTLYQLVRFGTMRNLSISSRLLRGYLCHPYVWSLGRNSAELGKTMLSEVEHVINTSIIPALGLLAHAVVVAALVIFLFIMNPIVMTMALLFLGGSYLLVFLSVKRLLNKVGEKRFKANADRFKIAAEALGGIKDVKLSGLEGNYLSRFRNPVEVYARAEAAGNIISEVPRYLLEAIAFGGMLILVLWLLLRHDARLESLIPFLGLFAFAGIRMFPAMQKIYFSFTYIQYGSLALDRLHRDMMESAECEFPAAKVEPMGLRDAVKLENVTYSYPGATKAALHELNLNIAANTTVGLVGGSGAGKTTVVDVVLGLLVPDRGMLRVDGQAITNDNRRQWQRSVGYVPQQIFLTDDSIAANIALGVSPEDIDFEAVMKAGRIAELHDFVTEELPDGYETMIGERGVRLSGGQRQRIGIARALYYDPDVLVFDEATSALDNLTERAVMDAVHNLSGAKTVIMVAHRLSTVERCDEIILLEHGRVTATGRYEDLLSTNDSFRRMVNAGTSQP
jgi:ATP-binding cassette, subfamily B, bacterial PglK